MTKAEIEAMLKQDEDAFLERKESAQHTDIKQSIVGFANTVPQGREAVLLIGQRSNKSIVGILNADKLQRDVREWAKQCYPPVEVRPEVVSTGQGQVVALVIPFSPKKPHFTGKAYKRVGSQTVEASEEILNELIASRNTKAGILLSYKGQTVTVDYEYHSWYPLGPDFSTMGPRGQPVLVRKEQYVIEGASAHSVELRNLASNRLESISLERIVITKDVQHHRRIRLRVKVQE